MKRYIPLILGLLAAVLSSNAARAEIRVTPTPDGEPASEYWSVEVDGKSSFVYAARTADPPFEKYDYGGEYAFTSIDADEPVTVTIRELSGAKIDALTVRPLSAQIEPVKNDDGSYTLTIDQPRQISVEYNGRVHPLLIFVNPPEENVPNAEDPNVIYYPRGVHRPKGGAINLSDNQTLYLAPGAVVHCGINVHGENVTIRGRGIIDSSDWEWRQGPTGHVVSINASKNVRLEGVTIRGASHWTVVPVNSDDVSIDNIKLCGGRVQNDDGINPCNSRRVTVKNAFIRTDDDCMALKGLDFKYGNCEDIYVENCVFWCDRARIVLMGHESRAEYMRRVTFKDIDVIHAQTRNFLLEPGERMKMEDALFENIRFETGVENALSPEALEKMKDLDVSKLRFDIDVANRDNWLFVARPTVNRYMQVQEPGHIANVTIRNITVEGLPSFCGMLFSGADETHRFKGLSIENVTVFGQKLDAASPLVRIGDFIDDVSIK